MGRAPRIFHAFQVLVQMLKIFFIILAHHLQGLLDILLMRYVHITVIILIISPSFMRNLDFSIICFDSGEQTYCFDLLTVTGLCSI